MRALLIDPVNVSRRWRSGTPCPPLPGCISVNVGGAPSLTTFLSSSMHVIARWLLQLCHAPSCRHLRYTGCILLLRPGQISIDISILAHTQTRCSSGATACSSPTTTACACPGTASPRRAFPPSPAPHAVRSEQPSCGVPATHCVSAGFLVDSCGAAVAVSHAQQPSYGGPWYRLHVLAAFHCCHMAPCQSLEVIIICLVGLVALPVSQFQTCGS